MSRATPRFDFIMFLLIFGWSGPLALYMGELVTGVVLTLFFWGLFGVDSLKDFIKSFKSNA